MGAWGPGIFSDDLASDLRDDFRDLAANGVDAVEVTRRLVAEYRPDHDPDDGPVFWIALAAVQWQLGRLDEEVKQRALDVIDSDADLHKWHSADARTIRRRRAVLEDLRARLLLPPPPPKRLRPRYVAETEFEGGIS